MINRLLGIIYILINKGSITARELAARFEVSVRTIYRDVEALSMAGIPIYTQKGRNGGIRLTEQFVLDKMLVSKEEQQQILSALTSIQETGAQKEQETIKKLSDFFKTDAYPWVSIDLSDWSGRRSELFALLKNAILNKSVLEFDYYGQYGEMTTRTVEPAQLVFKDYTWYLKGFCRMRQDMRLFKVLRMKRVRTLLETFSPCAHHEGKNDEYHREAAEKQISTENPGNAPLTRITLIIGKKEAYRIYDRFEEEEITVLPSGDFKVQVNYPLDDWVYGLILSFGASAKVTAPISVQKELLRRIDEIKKRYN